VGFWGAQTSWSTVWQWGSWTSWSGIIGENWSLLRGAFGNVKRRDQLAIDLQVTADLDEGEYIKCDDPGWLPVAQDQLIRGHGRPGGEVVV
jgi:hypothetical protein